jgi:hypothetical protein
LFTKSQCAHRKRISVWCRLEHPAESVLRLEKTTVRDDAHVRLIGKPGVGASWVVLIAAPQPPRPPRISSRYSNSSGSIAATVGSSLVLALIVSSSTIL